MYASIISSINTLLRPLETLLLRYHGWLHWCILLVLLYSWYFAQGYSPSLEWAKYALSLLWVILWMPIFGRIFGIRLFLAMLPLRQALGIVMGIWSGIHFWHMIPNLPYYIETQPILVILGIVPQTIIFLLTITSSVWIRKKMGKYWKKLHTMVYIVPPLILTQIALGTGQIQFADGISIQASFESMPWILLLAYYIAKICEIKGIRLYQETGIAYPKGQKFLCLPCGYMYDPLIGDEDSGIPKGTEFCDIPEGWRCPECGVTKADFIPYDEKRENPKIPVTVEEKRELNPTTIELIITTSEVLHSKIGQFATVYYTDTDGEFSRQYSISRHEGKRIHFLIKLNPTGRGGKILAKIRAGDTLYIWGFFGDFLLQNTAKPKIFIATGTGLAPVYRMMKSIPNIPKSLYFSVSTRQDMFYEAELKALENTDVAYYVSREKLPGYRTGRMAFEDIILENDAEVYLCGNPEMIDAFRGKFEQAGVQDIYYEKFDS